MGGGLGRSDLSVLTEQDRNHMEDVVMIERNAQYPRKLAKQDGRRLIGWKIPLCWRTSELLSLRRVLLRASLWQPDAVIMEKL